MQDAESLKTAVSQQSVFNAGCCVAKASSAVFSLRVMRSSFAPVTDMCRVMRG